MRGIRCLDSAGTIPQNQVQRDRLQDSDEYSIEKLLTIDVRHRRASLDLIHYRKTESILQQDYFPPVLHCESNIDNLGISHSRQGHCTLRQIHHSLSILDCLLCNLLFDSFLITHQSIGTNKAEKALTGSDVINTSHLWSTLPS